MSYDCDRTHHKQPPEQPKKKSVTKESAFFQLPEEYYEAVRLIDAFTKPDAVQHLSLQEVDIINKEASELEALIDDAKIQSDINEDKMTNKAAKRATGAAKTKIVEKAEEVMMSLQKYKAKIGL